MLFVVDDSEDFLEILQLLGTELGQDLKVARNGKEGLELFSRSEPWPRALFLDFFLPDINGHDFAQTLHARYPDKIDQLKIMVLSNLPPESPQLQGLKPLVSYIGPKPSDIDDLKSLILESQK